MTRTAATAQEAYERYKAFLASASLIQTRWHATADDGRALACGLGVIGDKVTLPQKCPTQIMPRWLAHMVPWLFDKQPASDAFAWGERLYAELARLDGAIPLSVVHDWRANVVAPLAIAISTEKKRNVAAHEALRDMHAKTLAGESFSADEWRPIIRATLVDAYAYAFADGDACAYADAFAEDDGHAYANANLDADTYSGHAYDDAYAGSADAYAHACAYDAAQPAIKHLADGLVECLARVL